MRTIKNGSARALALGAWLAFVPSAFAATSAETDAAIQKALAYFHTTQTAGGYWNYGGYEPAATGAAAYAMISQKGQWLANAAAYQTDVDEALAFLLSTASTATVSTRNDGANICPAGTGTCLGVFWDAANNEDTYSTGLIAPAIATYALNRAGEVATASGPLAGLTWGQIAQGITNMFAASQATTLNGNRRGGWRYYLPGNGDADMSTTQWAVIAMLYDQILGAVTPGIVKDDLKFWLAAVQAGDGSGCYQPGTGPCDNSDTGGMLLGLNLVGNGSSDPAVVAALGFLNATWQNGAGGDWYGNFGHPYAMWSVYKGLETTIGLGDTAHIPNLRPGQCGGDIPSSSCNWWQDYVEWLVSSQNADGSWGGYAYWTGPLATAFYLPILPPGARIPTSLDRFQCYRIKDSKGNLCATAAPLNPGASCETEEDCGGISDDTGYCVPTAFPKKLQATMDDQFQSRMVAVKKPLVLCNPAVVNTLPVNDDTTHLEGYQVAQVQGEPKFVPQRGLAITNEFHPAGELKVDTTRLQRLLVPTAKSLVSPPGVPGDNDVDHFACYSVKPSKNAPKLPVDLHVSVVDQFAQNKLYDVKKPTRLCVPVHKNGEGIKNADTDLMCYAVSPAKGQAKFARVVKIYVTNQFGREQVDASRVDDLCIPSSLAAPIPG